MPLDLQRRPLCAYPVHMPALTRWSDNDMYGHVNNAVYYELFDSAINGWLAEHTTVTFADAPVIGVVAESGCRFFAELAFPGPLTVALRVARLGRSSAVYELALFGGARPRADALANATGHWVHVYLDRSSRQPTEIPGSLRSAMKGARTSAIPAP